MRFTSAPVASGNDRSSDGRAGPLGLGDIHGVRATVPFQHICYREIGSSMAVVWGW